jgi:hypothetical protein
VQRFPKSGTRNYACISRVNTPANIAADRNKIQICLDEIGFFHKWSGSFLLDQYSGTLSVVDKYLSNRSYDSIFKGKWYAAFLSETAKQVTGKGSTDEKVIWATLVANVNAEHPGSDTFREALRNIVIPKSGG